jgi:hypothetical protein
MIALSFLSGCVIGGDRYLRPRDLAPASLVDRPRILAIAAEPPEARPGTFVSISALLARPLDDATDYVQIWLACPIDESGGFGCETDLSTLDPDDPAALLEAGVIGFEPGLPPSYVVPEDFLDDLPEEDRAEGAYVLLQTTAFPADGLEDPAGIDLTEAEIAYKRLVVSLAQTPNHNPVLGQWRVEGAPVPIDGIVHLQRRSYYDLAVEIVDTSIEIYLFRNSDGELEERVEEPYVAWFTTGGELQEEVTLFPYVDATWLSPSRSGAAGEWFAVVRDRRGGMSWRSQRWIVD